MNAHTICLIGKTMLNCVLALYTSEYLISTSHCTMIMPLPLRHPSNQCKSISLVGVIITKITSLSYPTTPFPPPRKTYHQHHHLILEPTITIFSFSSSLNSLPSLTSSPSSLPPFAPQTQHHYHHNLNNHHISPPPSSNSNFFLIRIQTLAHIPFLLFLHLLMFSTNIIITPT